jgi:hypothetical protein
MPYDPITEVVDERLVVDAAVLERIAIFRARSKLPLLPGVDPTEERERLSKILNELADKLLAGLTENPTKLWVMKVFQQALIPVEYEDTEGREHFGMELEQLMDVLGIESSDGLLNFYLLGM